MKRYPSLVQTLALAGFTMSVSAYGQNAPKIVTSYCSGCHGVDGNAKLPYFPRIAGLDPVYAEKKLAAFREPASPPVDELFGWMRMRRVSGANADRRNLSRQERINMEGVAHAANPDAVHLAVVWYAGQRPAPGRPVNSALAEKGKKLSASGLPAKRVPACLSCHGLDAQGDGPAPRLAGQNAAYIEAQLAKFRKGDRRHAPEMTLVMRDLDDEQARAAAAYFQSR
jgi:cytochrome c553